jgi:hypothetical protein
MTELYLETFHPKIPWLWSVTSGDVAGVEHYRQFGRNLAVGTSEVDVGNLGADLVHLTTAETMYASCTEIGAAAVLFVVGLGPNWKRQKGLVTLNGRTQAAITDLSGAPATWVEITTARVISAEGTEPSDGEGIWLATSSAVSGGVPTVQASKQGLLTFGSASQVTSNVNFTIPNGKVGYVYGVHASMIESIGAERSAEVRVELAELARDATIQAPAWTPRFAVDEMTVSTMFPRVDVEYPAPIVVRELTQVHIRAVATSNCKIYAGFSVVLIPEDPNEPAQPRDFDTVPL